MRRALGQTLLETLITVAFLAVSVMAMVRFQGYLSYDSILTQQKAHALQLAISQLETLRDYQVLNNTSGYTSWQGIASATTTTAGTTTTYTITTTVATTASPSYKNIRVVVSWTDIRGTAQSIGQELNIAGIDPAYSAAIM